MVVAALSWVFTGTGSNCAPCAPPPSAGQTFACEGVPVAAVAIGNSRNAGLLAVRILAASDPNLQQQMIAYQAEMAIASRKKNIALRDQQIGG